MLRRFFRTGVVLGLLTAAPLVFALEVNTATRAQLEQLNGIGVTLAEKILIERDKAPFRDWEDLQTRVKGMRGARTQRLQGSGVTVNGVPGSRAAQEEKK